MLGSHLTRKKYDTKNIKKHARRWQVSNSAKPHSGSKEKRKTKVHNQNSNKSDDSRKSLDSQVPIELIETNLRDTIPKKGFLAEARNIWNDAVANRLRCDSPVPAKKSTVVSERNDYAEYHTVSVPTPTIGPMSGLKDGARVLVVGVPMF